MQNSQLLRVLLAPIAAILLLLLGGLVLFAADTAPAGDPKDIDKLIASGNWKDALERIRPVLADAKTAPGQATQRLRQAFDCLNRLGLQHEFDEVMESAIAAQPNNWRLLALAGELYMGTIHEGFIVAGKFERGYRRGGTGRPVSAFDRDRVRALQLYQQAMPLALKEQANDAAAVGQFFISTLAQGVQSSRGGFESWRLQYLTDLGTLPDYEEGHYGWRGGGDAKGAPVGPDGEPVYYAIPKSWDASKNDGERWRWAMMQAAEISPALREQAMWTWATFLQQQFDVQTMAYLGRPFDASTNGEQAGDKKKDDELPAGPFAVRTLGEDETIARLATGVRRFKLPADADFIRIFKTIADEKKGYVSNALETLASIHENRQQFPRAADDWRRVIKEHGPGHENYRQKRLDQIIKPWGRLEMVMTQPAGSGASFEFTFRNAKKVSFEAFEIDATKVLADVKAYIQSKPRQLDWQQINIQDLGHRIVVQNQRQYLVGAGVKWEKQLEPRAEHFDRRVTVESPLKKPGAYLVTATLPDGNTTQMVIWIADTVILKKPLDQGMYLFIGDAVTGAPVAGAKVQAFGFRQRWVENKGGRGGEHVVDFSSFDARADENGQVIRKNVANDNEYQWVLTASAEPSRTAYLGFTSVWGSNWYDHEYNQTKSFIITDRPVYRPEQGVKFKAWIAQAKYDQQDKSPYEGQSFQVRITDPRGEKFWEETLKADSYGGIQAEFTLKKDVTLGVYSIQILNGPGGASSFRVEEYKKPEFEVSIDAPTEPVMLGEKFGAIVKAKYLFGAPVAEAKVKYKVLRSGFDGTWYPPGRWDWFYGPGYWWFACDYGWYPGWRMWGCKRPMFLWWPGWRPQPQPEIVAEGEAAIGKDGTLKVPLDTALAKEIHGDEDHRYEITAEVTDASRRVIVGSGSVLVARQPFRVYAWTDRGHYRAGDVVHAELAARTLDGKPVKGKGTLRLLRVSYDENGKVTEKEQDRWDLNTNDEGRVEQHIKAAKPGQYRLSYKLSDNANHIIEGGYVFTVMGDAVANQGSFRFNDVELIADKREYQAGEKVNLRINANREGATVLLFVRPTNGVYLAPKVVTLKGKSVAEALDVAVKDMPNFFVEATTISGGRVFEDVREVVVPPASRVVKVEALASAQRYKPGEKATIKLKLTDETGEPFVGSTVVSVYDKAVEYISGGSNVPEIRAFFWKWRRQHNPSKESNADRFSHPTYKPGEQGMAQLGVFDNTREGGEFEATKADLGGVRYARVTGLARREVAMPAAAPMMMMKSSARAQVASEANFAAADMPEAKDAMGRDEDAASAPGVGMKEATVRTNFADTALWVASLTTNEKGEASVELTMPENLTTWKARVWAMGRGTRVGEATTEIVTSKDLIVRLQAPRFFVEKDEVVISANVHNYLKTDKSVRVALKVQGRHIQPIDGPPIDKDHTITLFGFDPTVNVFDPKASSIRVSSGGEKRIDWRVRVVGEGVTAISVTAQTDEESDAMEMKFPVYVHGMLKTDSFSGVVRPDKESASIAFNVPKERRPDQSRVEVRYSPTLAGAMVDALPYLVEYPYGCTEQTLSRFLPTVMTQRTLQRMGVDFKDIQKKITNLNAQEIGDDVKRSADWQRLSGTMRWNGEKWVKRDPVFDPEAVKDMVETGVARLASMQCADGGWGWFSGFGEQSYPHTTAYVVHGLMMAKSNDVALKPSMLERGVEWLKRYQTEQTRRLKLPKDDRWHKPSADHLDAFAFMVLVDADVLDKEMQEFLYRDRNNLAVYAKAMFGLALHKIKAEEQLAMVVQNIDQFLVQDDENQTAYLKLPESNYWWCWYGSEYEAQAYYLKLLSARDPKGEKASRLVKYLINNRRHASYWNSTRDTAVVVEAFADYIKASGEDTPDMTVQLVLDGKPVKEVKINKDNLFTFDNKLVLEGKAIADGAHKLEVHRTGKGPVYFNAYVTNFTLEDLITKAGLEVKVNRKFYKLVRVDATVKAQGSRGQAVDEKVEKYKRELIPSPFDDVRGRIAPLKSGDLVEVELEIDSKNDYEYLVFEDMKAAGFEPVEVRSGYNGNEMGAYVEFRDERVCFFTRVLPRGKHSISYRLRAEVPGSFSALPTRASAMYAPELKANSDEMKIGIID